MLRLRSIPWLALHLIWWACMPDQARSQWAPAGLPFRITEMGNIFTDTIEDAIYFCGESSLNNDFDMSDGAIPVYRNGQWDTLGVFNGRPQTITRWHDTLVVAGYFNHVNGMAFPGVVAYHQGQWIPYGSLDNVYRLKVVDGNLYAIGGIQAADGSPCKGIAKRIGGSWEPVGTVDVYTPPNIQDLVSWNGILITTGTIRFSGGQPRDVAYLADSVWHPLGVGILGGFSAGRSLCVYQGDLYVSGSIDIAAGNAGHGIMRWDGNAFHPVGSGLQGITNNFSILCGSVEMEVRNGLLWACGTFQNAGHVPAPGIATWDGNAWCGLPLGPQPECNSIEFYHDTLFAGCHVFLNGEPVYCAVRFTGSAYADTCSVPLSMPEQPADRPISVHSDSDGQLSVIGLPRGRTECAVFDMLGRCVLIAVAENHGQASVAVHGRMLSAGTYVLRTTIGSTIFDVP